MKKLKKALIGLLALTILVIGGAFAALQMMDVERIRSFLQSQIEAATGRTVTIAGDVKPTLGLSPTITLSDVTLSNPSWAKSGHLLKAAELHVSLRVLPLLSGDIAIRQVRVAGADIHLEKSKKGTPSWKFKADEEKLKELEEAQSMSLTINEVTLTDSLITYRDLKSGKAYKVKANRLTVNDIVKNTVGRIALDGEYKAAALNVSGAVTDDFIMLDAALKGKDVSASAKGSMALADSTFDMEVTADAKQLKQLLALLDIKSDNSEPLSLSSEIGGKPDIVTFSKLNAKYGPFPVSGSGSINLTGSVPYLSAKLASSEINLKGKSDAPAAAGPAEGETAAKASGLIPDIAFPVDALATLNADIELAVKKIQLDKLVFHDATATVGLKDKRLRINPVDFQTSKGWVKGYFIIDGSRSPTYLSIDLVTNDVNLGALLTELESSSSIEGGSVKSHIKIKGNGPTLKQALAASNGQVNFFVNQTVYKSPPTLARAADFLDILRSGNSKDITVNCMVGRFKVTDGTAASEALALKTGGAIVTGNGSVNIGKERIDMRLKARSSSVGLADLVPAVRLDGPLLNPSVYPDPGSALLSIGKYVVGAATGVGLVAILGEKATDTIGLTADNNPCLQSIVQIEQDAEERGPDDAVDAIKKAPAKVEDNVRQGIKDVEDQTKQLRDGVRGLLKN